MEGLKNRFRKEAVATARVLDAIAVVRLERERVLWRPHLNQLVGPTVSNWTETWHGTVAINLNGPPTSQHQDHVVLKVGNWTNFT